MIIGAGPAGLTAAYELVTKTTMRVVVLEKDEQVGGISRTCTYKGNRIDIGGHRFFSKSDRVVEWWLRHLPLAEGKDDTITGYGHQVVSKSTSTVAPSADRVMLVRERQSHIYFMRRLFSYPITLGVDTLRKLGLVRTLSIGTSYMRARLFPIRPERNLEHLFVNRFGWVLYRTFFKSYTEKVWGVPCHEISAEWGAQRVKGLSISRAVAHALRRLVPWQRRQDIQQKDTETSLIERFLYPRLGPGQMWEAVAEAVIAAGGQVLLGWSVDRVRVVDGRVLAVEATRRDGGERRRFSGDWFVSTMPIRDLTRALDPPAPPEVSQVSEGLRYRDFVTVGLLVDRMKIQDGGGKGQRLVRDNWIYIQESDVRVGRLQIFNNWSPHMVADPSKVWLGLEYFCNETDDLWRMPDSALIRFGASELHRIGIIDQADVLDGTVIRVEKAYPAYFGSYDRIGEVRAYFDGFPNLFLVGRNGMHRYNNQDHSMLAAMAAAENIMAGRTDKAHIWEINTEEEYHESK